MPPSARPKSSSAAWRNWPATAVLTAGASGLIQRAVEQAFRLPCRYSYRHSPKNVGTDADVAPKIAPRIERDDLSGVDKAHFWRRAVAGSVRVPEDGCILAYIRVQEKREGPVERGGLQCPVICSKYPTARQRGPL